jgi:hypothetical protein
MPRKFILSLAAAAAFAAATLVSGAANAHHSGGHWGGHGHFRHHVHFSHLRGGVYVQPVGYAVRAVEPGPCTCLSKKYTPEGQVVFKDQCTKEVASAQVNGGSDQTQNEQDPANASDQTNQDDNSQNATDGSK